MSVGRVYRGKIYVSPVSRARRNAARGGGKLGDGGCGGVGGWIATVAC